MRIFFNFIDACYIFSLKETTTTRLRFSSLVEKHVIIIGSTTKTVMQYSDDAQQYLRAINMASLRYVIA